MTDTRAERFILKPTAGRVTVRVKDVEKETKSGLLLVGTSHEPKPTTGMVVEVCDEDEYEDIEGEEYEPVFERGDLVVFGKFSGTTVTVGREKYIVLKESDIVARLVPSDEPEAVSPNEVRVHAPAEG